MSDTKTIKILVSGKVQGVFYRQSTKEKADQLKLKGIVRNLEDGRVEIIATGDDGQINQLVKWCHHGPPRAKVNSVDVTALPFQSFDNFKVNRN